MAIVKMCRPGKSLKTVLNYVCRKDKTVPSLMHGIECSEEYVYEDMMATKQAWGKENGRQYMHLSINYHAQEGYITPGDVLEYTKKLISETKAFEGFEALITVHIDRAHLHSHVILNSVNYQNGHKIQFSHADLRDLKERCNQLSLEKGLHVPQKGLQFDGTKRDVITSWNKDEYQLLMKVSRGKAVSWKATLAGKVANAALIAKSRAHFVSLLGKQGVEVVWADERKHITFVDKDGNKSRDNKLQKYLGIPLDKEGLQEQFFQNSRQPGPLLYDMTYLQKLADSYVQAAAPDADEDFYVAFWEKIEEKTKREGYWQTVAMLKDELNNLEKQKEQKEIEVYRKP